MSALLVLDWSVPHSRCSWLDSAVTLRYQATDPIFLFVPPLPDLVAAHLLLRHGNSVSALAVLCCTLYTSHDPPRLDVWGHWRGECMRWRERTCTHWFVRTCHVLWCAIWHSDLLRWLLQSALDELTKKEGDEESKKWEQEFSCALNCSQVVVGH
jgi:hypothetical protein